jgi:CheY-like chemotaxis protein
MARKGVAILEYWETQSVASRNLTRPSPELGRKMSPRFARAFAQKRDQHGQSMDVVSKRTIAVVEDEEDLLPVYSLILQDLGYEKVFITKDAEELVKAVIDRTISPDIIMDYRLPGMDGIEAAKIILQQVPSTMVIVTTADDTVKDKSISLGLKFLQKPFSMKALAKKIEETE